MELAYATRVRLFIGQNIHAYSCIMQISGPRNRWGDVKENISSGNRVGKGVLGRPWLYPASWSHFERHVSLARGQSFRSDALTKGYVGGGDDGSAGVGDGVPIESRSPAGYPSTGAAGSFYWDRGLAYASLLFEPRLAGTLRATGRGSVSPSGRPHMSGRASERSTVKQSQ